MIKPVYRCLLMAVFIMGLTYVSYADDIVDQKNELEKIQRQIDESKRNLDSLKGTESSLLKEISDYEQRESINKTVINRLNKQLSTLRANIDNSKNRLDDAESRYAKSHDRYLNNLTYYYTGLRNVTSDIGDEIKREFDSFRRAVYLKSLALSDRDYLSVITQHLGEAAAKHSNLINEEHSVGEVRNNKRSEYTIISSQRQKREKDLSKVRHKKESEADRLITLSEAARQMEDLIVRLETARKARTSSPSESDFNYETGNFASYKGRLLSPFDGKIISNFGWKTDKITYLKSYSPGIEIEGKKNASVRAVASGVVAYTGFIRGYSNFVIIEHEDGYYSTYAGLDKLEIIQEQIVSAGEKLGVATTGVVKFELRQGKQPLDPVEWVKIESFK
ncbi:MAG: peptidoglycan DD-metalloendopeptidase family protein [Candidatus Zixiibacteriota bacterium]